MTSSQATALLASAGELLLLGLVLRRARRSPLALPLIGLSLVLFAWNAAEFCFEVAHAVEWRLLDVTFSPLSTPLALHFVVGFVGKRRPLRWVLLLAYLYFGALSVAGALAFISAPARAFVLSEAWSVVHLIGIALGMSLIVGLLLLHLRSTRDAGERGRTRILLVAMGVAGVCGMSELLRALGLPTPQVAALGVLVGNALLVMVTLRIQLFDRRLSMQDAIFALVVALSGVGFVFEALHALEGRSAVAAVAVTTLTLVVIAGVRFATLTLREDQEQMEQLLNLGRISTQLAHDLKNPLAALRGAAQFLQGEVQRGNDVRAHERFFSLLIDQADRMERVIDVYQRLGRMRPVRAEHDLNALVRRVCEAQAVAAGEKVKFVVALQEALPRISVDADLVQNALENVLSNAFRAMPNGGTVQVKTAEQVRSDRRHAVLSIVDDGMGMDARTAERAMEDFFSTRADGTGLGLAFVQRICEAHGGHIDLVSRQGEGTRVELWLPSEAPVPGGEHG